MLCWEIPAFPGLINSHRNIHGDAPRPLPTALPRWNNPRSASYSQRGGAFSRNFQPPRNFHPRQTHSWRKKYSLDNRLPGSASEAGSASRVFGSSGDIPAPEPPESSPERHVDFTTDGNIVVDIQVPQRAGDGGDSREFSGREAAAAPAGGGKSIPGSPYGEEERPSLSISFSSTSRTVCLPGIGAGSSFSPSGSSSESAVTLKSEPQEPLEFAEREPAGNSVRIKAEPPSPGRSWEEIRDVPVHPKLFGNDGMSSVPAPGGSRIPGVPKPPVSGKALKFRRNNYTWVANPGKSWRLGRRWVGTPRKGLVVGAERGAKPTARTDLGGKAKKPGMPAKLGASPSKYKWKASTLQALPSTSSSAFRWRSQEQRETPAPGVPGIPHPGVPALAPGVPHSGVPPPAPGIPHPGVPHPGAAPGAAKSSGEAPLSSYKVKSRTKIIKRRGNVGFPTEKKNISPGAALRSRFHLRRKNSARGKTSAAPKRSSPKIPAQVSRHRICRIPVPTRTQVAAKEGRDEHSKGFP
ncbi:zinc finger CCCH domain-containing protein 3-like, partial [Empidonax traillii]|uniref:zinc finger CCCH domain-containing protein 3-like n=1 Tax=Empidonax traillii TaxID=164674 RepID=UPI000FFD49EE